MPSRPVAFLNPIRSKNLDTLASLTGLRSNGVTESRPFLELYIYMNVVGFWTKVHTHSPPPPATLHHRVFCLYVVPIRFGNVKFRTRTCLIKSGLKENYKIRIRTRKFIKSGCGPESKIDKIQTQTRITLIVSATGPGIKISIYLRLLQHPLARILCRIVCSARQISEDKSNKC